MSTTISEKEIGAGLIILGAYSISQVNAAGSVLLVLGGALLLGKK